MENILHVANIAKNLVSVSMKVKVKRNGRIGNEGDAQ